MDLDQDDLAGVLDLFGGLTSDELDRALEEMAFRAGDPEDDPGTDLLTAAEDEFVVVEIERDDGKTWYFPGPTAFPTVPEAAQDLPQILDLARRSIDREALGRAAVQRFRAEAARAVNEGDEDRMGALVDLSYEIEAWAPVDVSSVRDRLDDAMG